MLHVFFHSKDPHRAIINERSGCLMHPCTGNTTTVLAEGGRPFVAENLHVSLNHKELTLATGRWRVWAQSTVGRPHPNQLRMNVEVKVMNTYLRATTFHIPIRLASTDD